MSWSATAHGKTEEVRASIDRQLAAIIENRYVIDEAELRHVADARHLIASILADFRGATGVVASAYGSQASTGDSMQYGFAINICPLWKYSGD